MPPLDLSALDAQLRNSADAGYHGDACVSQETLRELVAIARAVEERDATIAKLTAERDEAIDLARAEAEWHDDASRGMAHARYLAAGWRRLAEERNVTINAAVGALRGTEAQRDTILREVWHAVNAHYTPERQPMTSAAQAVAAAVADGIVACNERDTARAERLAAEQIAARAMCAEREAVAKLESLRPLAAAVRAADAHADAVLDASGVDAVPWLTANNAALMTRGALADAVLALFPEEP